MDDADGEANQSAEVRFEDLTIDDDLPILDRIVRYIQSQVALQRLVHVKMIAETAELVGSAATCQHLIPALAPLIQDPESVIRQHLAAQLLHVALVAMLDIKLLSKQQQQQATSNVQHLIEYPHEYSYPHSDELVNKIGYDLVTKTIIDKYLNALIADADLDVRRAAATTMATLAIHLKAEDVPVHCLPISLKLVQEKLANPMAKKRSDADTKVDELRITACNLLAELAGAASEREYLRATAAEWVPKQVLPAVLQLCADPSFRVRRSAVQALPRLLAACDWQVVKERIVPAFEELSSDQVHRIRKSSGECLVDMSRSLMILAAAQEDANTKDAIFALRREKLIPIADRLIQDSHKMVRQGMMQFLGPFLASFYPFQYSILKNLLPTSTESDGSNHTGIVSQFFPHATSMVSRLNSSQNSVTLAPTPVHSHVEQLSPRELSDGEKLYKALPVFLQAHRLSTLALHAVCEHRKVNPPEPEDIQAIQEQLLDYFAALAIVTTGDENTDAEMRVYCAYSFPAIALLLGPEHWEGPLKTCFFSLLNSNYAKGGGEDGQDEEEAPEPPLPVKRCLASSLHTVAWVLGAEATSADILPVFLEYFLNDGDESVRLNVIRNFPYILELLPATERKEPFVQWYEVVMGDEFLGARKRSASNPLVLNWRQRDYLARSLPMLIQLLDPMLIRDYIWPVLQVLLTDPICSVREDAMWAVPMMLRAFCADTVTQHSDIKQASKWSIETSLACTQWVKEKVLKIGAFTSGRKGQPKVPKANNFSDRQLYCRICAALGLALRFSEDIDHRRSEMNDPASELREKYQDLFQTNVDTELEGPYMRLTKAEQKHLRKLLMENLIDEALIMKEDKISNVRVSLMRALQIMPTDIRSSKQCAPVLKELEEEVETWESFGSDDAAPAPVPAPPSSSPPRQKSPRHKHHHKSVGENGKEGPIDLDSVAVTPQSSHEEEDPHNEHASQGSSSGSSHEPELKFVVFEEGPIGMQLEPTRYDRSCRVFDFLDTGTDQPSPARASGLIEIGDVIVSVNGQDVNSYDDTIAIIKNGGRREIAFRAGTSDDIYDVNVDDSSQFSTDESQPESAPRRKDRKVCD
jgi:serine/threonine-protein phosphatase 4 regulatory subunit 1